MARLRLAGRVRRFTSTIVLSAVLTAATMTPATAAPTPTPADQLAWVITASAHTPLPTAELDQRLSAGFLTGVGGPTAVNADLATVGPLTLDYTVRTSTSTVEAVTSGPQGDYLTELELDTGGLIDALVFTAQLPGPTSWAAIDAQLTTLAPQVSFTARSITPTGSCTAVHSVAATTPRPLGSAFKLYVLGALGHAISTHTATWNQNLAIRDAWKSLPSGVLQNEPAGTELPIASYADDMISISDNTAADHLIHLLGRAEVQAQLSRFGNSDPALTTPFPTTRELFTLKSFHYPVLADAYLAYPPALRRVELAASAAVPLSSLGAWTQPEDIDQLEWLGSAADMCRALAGLWQQSHQPGLAPIGAAMSINDGGLALNPATDPVVWYKGGDEPGVLTLNFLVQTNRGDVVAVSILLADPTAALDEAAIEPRARAIVRGALALSLTTQ